MSRSETFRLLIINDSQPEAERLISMLNNAGHPNRAQFVTSEEALNKLIEEQNWDLLIAQSDCASLAPAIAIRQIKRHNRDIPTLILMPEEDPKTLIDSLKMGARDALVIDDDQHLLLVIDRELGAREERMARRRADRKLKESERRGQQLLDSSRDAIAYVQDGLLMYVNESFAERFGYEEDKDDLECFPMIDLVITEEQDRVKQFLRQFQLKGDEAEDTQLEFNAYKADGSIFKAKMAAANAIYEDEPCLQIMMRASAVGSEELEAQLEEVSTKDAVTGLYNRQYMQDHLSKLLKSSSESDSTSALLYIDIDHFDELIAKHGATMLDQINKGLATHLSSHSDENTVGHYGDGVFLLTIEASNASPSLQYAEKLAASFASGVIELEEGSLQVTASIGVSLLNELTTDLNAAINEAHAAAEQVIANNNNGNGAALYEPDDASSEENIGVMARKVQEALQEHKFQLMFQPIISLRGDEQEHYEVLLRMNNDNGEDFTPEDFMPAAAHGKLIGKLDRWVIVEATKALAAHHSKGNKTTLLIHLHEETIKDDKLANWLAMAFKATKLNPANLIFQLSEKDITGNISQASNLMKQLEGLGCKTALNNFGCSLNPLTTLQHVTPSHIKVDGSFTQDIQNNESPEALKTLISSLQESGKIIIVPFVENASVLQTLWQVGAHYIQGHYLQAPTDKMNYDFSMDE